MAYAVVRTDNLSGIVDGSKLVSVVYNDGTNNAAIENGSIVKLDSYTDRDYWKAVKPTANDYVGGAPGKLALVASSEVVYDKKYNALADFINEKDEIARGYVLEHGDIFSVTAEAFTDGDTPSFTSGSTKKVVVLEGSTSGCKLTAQAAAPTSGDTTLPYFADVIGTDTENGYTYYVLRVC